MGSILFITNEDNISIILEKNVMGIGGRWGSRLYPKIRIGDKCVIYVNKQSYFAGIYEIVSERNKSDISWKSGRYQYLFNLKPILIAKKEKYAKDLIQNLTFIKNKKNWYCHFRFERIIPDLDLQTIKNWLNNN